MTRLENTDIIVIDYAMRYLYDNNLVKTASTCFVCKCRYLYRALRCVHQVVVVSLQRLRVLLL